VTSAGCAAFADGHKTDARSFDGYRGHIAIDPDAEIITFDLDTQTVTCPAGITTTIRALKHQRHAGIAEFGDACATCPLAAECTTATAGRTITIGHHERQLAAGRARQTGRRAPS
jgi:hypothetical protein